MLGNTAEATTLFASLLLPSFISASLLEGTGENSTQTSIELTGFPPCDTLISAGFSSLVIPASSPSYESRIQSWWSANARYHPWCLIQPTTTADVSAIIKTLSPHISTNSGAGDWHIAVRSGGHSFPGSNNIINGVTIDLGMMNASSYDPQTNLSSVEPGAKWKNVYADLLHNYNVTVTGGRDGGVGVGGFLLGGGNSYYSGRNGFGCDTVVNYEVVLANGTVVDANASSHPDLWRALKGGGLNFGIVTRFDLLSMPAVDLAYGQSVVASDHSDQVIDAVVEFTDRMEEARDDHLISVYIHDTNISEEDVTILLIRVNTLGDLNSTSYERIKKIPAVTSNWEHMSLADAANASQVPAGTKNAGSTLTFLNHPANLRKAASLHKDLVKSLTKKIGAENFTTQMFFQPLPSYLGSLGQKNGLTSNVIGLDHLPSNSILWTTGVSVKDGEDATLAIAHAGLAAMTAKLKAFVTENGKAAELVYLNYAFADQDPLGSYGPENVKFMKDVAARYDPEGFWQTRVPGGFKLSRVAAPVP